MAAESDTVAAFEDALDAFCHAISWIATEIENQWQIEAFCHDRPDPDRLNQAMATVAAAFSRPPPQLHIEPVAARDWLIENLQTFPPIHAGRYFIYGSHFEGQVPPDRTGICLNPGRAFGSGDHATTRGCLLAMDFLAKSHQFANMLDMGCGSGILSIAMARTWSHSMTAPIIATDNDPMAARVSAENTRRNGVQSRIRPVTGEGYKSVRVQQAGPFDLIVSNILANPLCRMAADLGRYLNKTEQGGGIAVLSGFLIRDSNRVLAAHLSQGLHLVCWYDIKGWRTLVLAR